MAKKKAKSAFRHDVRYIHRGQTRYGVVSNDKSKKPGHIFIDDSILPFRDEVLDDDTVVDLESSFASKDNCPVYDRMSGLLVSGGNEKDKWMNAEQMKAEAISKAAGKGVVVGKLFSIGVADGHATYVITKIAGSRVTVEWRGFGNGDRYTDHFFGYGKTVSSRDVARYIGREESMADFLKKSDDRDRDMVERQPLGSFIHYVAQRWDDGWAFHRFEIVEKDGEKVAKFVGACGVFPDHALPHRNAWGDECMSGDLKRLLADPYKVKMCASYVWETAQGDTADLKRSQAKVDPATLPLLDLTMPNATPEQLECKRLNGVLQLVRNAANGEGEKRGDFNSKVARQRLLDAYCVLQAEFGK